MSILHLSVVAGFLLMSIVNLSAEEPARPNSVNITWDGSGVPWAVLDRSSTGSALGDKATSLALTPEPAGYATVTDEPYRLSSTLPIRYEGNTHLKGTISGGTSLPGCLVPGSVVVKLSDGTVMEQGKDYDVNTTWAAVARKEGGRILADTEVLITYGVGLMRIDNLVINADNTLTVIKGVPSKDTPEPPVVAKGTAVTHRLFMPYHTSTLQPYQVFQVNGLFPEPDSAEILKRAALVPKTLAKLREGKPVTVVTWGDSVTAGGDASTPDKAFASLFVTRLRERFPKADIKHINAGIGATNTEHRLPKLKEQVLDHKPDLVTIEFINDMIFPEELYRKNHTSAIDQIRAAGAEVIEITPHFANPEMMGHEHPRGKETRQAVEWLRSIAKEKNIGLADTSRRWEHLEAEGIPYITYLKNGINHPDDRGHELFVKDLMTFFPK